MNAPLYTVEILRLAASLPAPAALERVDGVAERRSPTCGSKVRTEVAVDGEGRVVALSQTVQACAFGQASASLVAAHGVGRSGEDMAQAVESLRDWLAGKREDGGQWPAIQSLAPARSRTGRHGAIVLPFETLLDAIKAARA
ncbi:MAG: iron-sulfur cluster assembly scaffold protein [Sphingomicrobium sp.]